MCCAWCSESRRRRPRKNDRYVCSVCDQRWWRYNRKFHLWITINCEELWRKIIDGEQVSVVNIGLPFRS